MSYRSILTHWDGSPDSDAHIDVAHQIAEKFGGHVTALCLATQPSLQAVGYGGYAGALNETAMTAAREEAALLEQDARAALDRIGGSWETRKATAFPENVAAIFAALARYADLTVVGRPYGGSHQETRVRLAEGALFDGGQGALICPDAPVGEFGARVTLAWNGGPEALRAARAALPFLIAAEAVDIVTVDAEDIVAGMSGEPGADIATLLARHGVKADIRVLPREGRRVSDVIMGHVVDSGASLLVAGAYGKSRFREAIFGGATREFLHDSPAPTLLAH